MIKVNAGSNLDYLLKVMREVGPTVKGRIGEFERERSEEELFEELCFCLLTANFTAEGGIRIQKKIGNGFLKLSQPELVKRLKELGHRYPNARASYIVEARRLYGKLGQLKHLDARDAREWLVRNVKGLGYKEASHFLRNVGFEDVAIIDRHVLRFLKGMGLTEGKRRLGRRDYMRIEEELSKIAKGLEVSLGELDLYIWYMMTGKVLK